VKRKLLIVPVLALGALGFWLLARDPREPDLRPASERAARVRVISAPKLAVVPRAVGFGVARPGRVWHAVPQVGGRIVELDPRVREGNILPGGTVLLKIDRTDYELDVVQAEAQIRSIGAQLDQLAARRKTLDASLSIEENSLELARAELERVRTLVERESLAAAQLDAEKRKALTQEARVQDIRNSLALIGPDRAVLEAKRAVEEARLAQAKLNVERTVIRAPFACRFGPVDVETDQVVQPGQELFFADSVATSEVTGQFPIGSIAHVFPDVEAPIDATEGGLETLREMGLSATVLLQIGSRTVEWEGAVSRIEGIDPQTRTVGVVVTVADTYKSVRPASRPPLVRGMYVETVVRGRPIPETVVVPRSALHAGQVYVVDAANRMTRRAVEVAFVQSGFAAVASGLSGGETVVLSDLQPAVEGMLLDPEPDSEMARSLEDDALGRTRLR